MTADRAIRSVVIVAYEGCQSLDVSGPWEVFTKANLAAAKGDAPGPYRLLLASPAGGVVTCNSGLALANTVPLAEVRARLQMPIHTLMVAGGHDGTQLDATQPDATHAELVPWLKQQAPEVARLCSVCTGAFLLAATGLLEGRRVSTHWHYCAELCRQFPNIKVEVDAIFVADPPYFSSAGVTAGIDLSLALVEADLGFDVALHVARHLVLYLRRQGGQSQYSAPLQLQASAAAGERFAALRGWMQDQLRGELTVAVLAARACMSVRQFGRAFRAETGKTPARYVEQLRLEQAKQRLAAGQQPLKRVAEGVGFGSVDALQRSLMRDIGITPSEFRKRFAKLT